MIGRIERVVGSREVGSGEVDQSIGCLGDRVRSRSVVIGGLKKVVSSMEVRAVGRM